MCLKCCVTKLPGELSLVVLFSLSQTHATAMEAALYACWFDNWSSGLMNRSSLCSSMKWVSTSPFSKAPWFASFNRKSILVGKPATYKSKERYILIKRIFYAQNKVQDCGNSTIPKVPCDMQQNKVYNRNQEYLKLWEAILHFN